MDAKQLEDFLDRVEVRCPRCDAPCAIVARETTPLPTTARAWRRRTSPPSFDPRRLACAACAFTAEWPVEGTPKSVRLGMPVDPWFSLPLVLQRRCLSDQRVWAYNHRHLDALEAFVADDRRDRARYGSRLYERLPAWMKAAKNREAVLSAIARLRSEHPET